MRNLTYDTIYVSNAVRLTRNPTILEPDELVGVVKLLPYPEQPAPPRTLLPEKSPMERIFSKRNDKWCALCLEMLTHEEATQAHILPKIFRKRYKYAHYGMHNKRTPDIWDGISLPTEWMFVYLCEQCRRREKKLDDIWANVLKTPLPFSHQEVRHRDGTRLFRDRQGFVSLREGPSVGPLKANVHLTITSPQPMLIQIAKLKTSYFLKLFSTLVFGTATPSLTRMEASKSSARQTIVEWMAKPKIDPQIIDYRSSDRPFPQPTKPLNFIQAAAAARVPQETAKRPIVAGAPHRKIIIELIPSVHMDGERH